MAAEKAPAFQFYPMDFLSDERVRIMSHTERGVYITLLCCCWLETSLPLDTQSLARLVNLPLKRFTNLWENSVLRQCFQLQDDGRLHHKRLDAERRKQSQFQQRQSDAGKASAAARAAITEQQVNHGSTSLVDVRFNSSSSSLSSSSEKKEKDRAHGQPVLTGSLPREHLTHAFCDPTFSICVPSAVHAKFIGPMSRRHGGDREQAHTALLAWYAQTAKDFPPDFVMGDAFKCWQPLFDAAFATTPAKAGGKLTEDAASQDAGVLEILRKKGAVG